MYEALTIEKQKTLTGDFSSPRKIRSARANPSRQSKSYLFAGIAITYTTNSCFEPSPVNCRFEKGSGSVSMFN